VESPRHSRLPLSLFFFNWIIRDHKKIFPPSPTPAQLYYTLVNGAANADKDSEKLERGQWEGEAAPQERREVTLASQDLVSSLLGSQVRSLEQPLERYEPFSSKNPIAERSPLLLFP
jgi:hypothetical protein